ncbi:MAG: M15 family metallopeptidase [Lachnospiraceae bacterium]|nr:M15 family metallopeptidase [Lachnospiraceae bacterium]
MLLKASGKLPDGYRFRIWDAWRPFALQKELYTEYSKEIVKEFELEECSQEQKNAVIRHFVSEPVEDRAVPPVHTTGGAIDLTILDEAGNELDMGTAFDAFSDLTYTSAFEKEKDQKIRDNRRLLYHVMTSVGFTNLPSEWWHYDYGDRFWAYYNDLPAIYEGVFYREEIHEKFNR